ncbi:hypothetical protein [Thermobacillus composti]|jgi:hypothetical protein|uniref:hypothetical protein n=1 Tax=Thermobacillus composti TaxID=377615 RepID=UPI0002EA89C1|nr:hypothetical protein [Thermobacillus composti]
MMADRHPAERRSIALMLIAHAAAGWLAVNAGGSGLLPECCRNACWLRCCISACVWRPA